MFWPLFANDGVMACFKILISVKEIHSHDLQFKPFG